MPSPIHRDLSVWADFNSVDEFHRFTASLRFADSAQRPEVGEIIRLHDDEGNSVKGVVEKLDGLTIYVRPEMETWTTEISLASPFVSQAPFNAAPQGDPVKSE
jgi:hypothetical protein